MYGKFKEKELKYIIFSIYLKNIAFIIIFIYFRIRKTATLFFNKKGSNKLGERTNFVCPLKQNNIKNNSTLEGAFINVNDFKLSHVDLL